MLSAGPLCTAARCWDGRLDRLSSDDFCGFLWCIIAYTQWSRGTTAWGIWLLIASLLVIVGLYGVALSVSSGAVTKCSD